MMSFWNLILLWIFINEIRATSPCTMYVRTSMTRTITKYYRHNFSCGFLGLGRCYNRRSSRGYITVYASELQCCAGYSGPECLPICNPSCGTNQECSSPYTCTCVNGWTGSNCHKDINECAEGIHLCEESCENTNGSYTCLCDSGNTVIANDENNCLGGINEVFGIPETHTITLMWSSPTNYMHDGTFSGYIVTCNRNSDNKTVANPLALLLGTSYTASSLNPFTQYKCCIEPHWTTNGVGPTVCIEHMTLEDAPDDSPQNISIIAADSVSVLIQWQPPHMPNGIITHYNIYIDFTNGTNITTNSVLGDSTLYLLDQLSVFQLVGVSISAITGGGEGPMSSFVFNTSAETEPGQVHHFAIDIISNTSANISWHPPVSLNGVIISYHIVIRNLTGNNSGYIMSDWILESSDRYYIIDDLVDVVAETKVGKGNLAQKLFFTVQSVPFLAPSWSIVHRESATEVQLQWTRLSLATSRGYITEYNIKYAQSINSTCVFTENVTHIQIQQEQLLLTELNPKYEYCVSIAASTEMGIGIFSEWTLVEVFAENVNVYYFLSGVPNCTQWGHKNKQIKLKTTSSVVIAGLHHSCQCHVTEDYIQSIVMLPCVTEGSVVVKITLTLIKGYTGEEMLMFLKEWSDTVPTIKLDGLVLSIESVCNSSDCLLATSPITKERANSTFISTVTVPIVVIIIIGIIIVILKIKRSRASREYSINGGELNTNKGKDMNNPCYQARQLPDKAIYDQPHCVNNNLAETKMNKNLSYSTSQSSLKSCHITRSATTDDVLINQPEHVYETLSDGK